MRTLIVARTHAQQVAPTKDISVSKVVKERIPRAAKTKTARVARTHAAPTAKIVLQNAQRGVKDRRTIHVAQTHAALIAPIAGRSAMRDVKGLRATLVAMTPVVRPATMPQVSAEMTAPAQTPIAVTTPAVRTLAVRIAGIAVPNVKRTAGTRRAIHVVMTLAAPPAMMMQ